MSTTSFIADIGGMLGLCMGFSFVTLLEIVYFLSNVFFNSVSTKMKLARWGLFYLFLERAHVGYQLTMEMLFAARTKSTW